MVRRRAVALAAVVLVPFVWSPASGAATAWAPADEATIHPGVQVFTADAQCTANFVYIDGPSLAEASNVYLGQAAHCAGTGAATETNGCEAASLPLGTPVEITGASRPGVLAYSSWRLMQQRGETDADACAYNDLALIRVHPDDWGRVNPSVPVWGGPTALDTDGTDFFDDVYSYGNSTLRLGQSALSPQQGLSLGSDDGWVHPVYMVTPGVPGDSGSGFLDGDGKAIGVLSTIVIVPLPASNDVIDLSHALAYLRAHAPGFAGVRLVPGTEPF